MRQEEVSLCLLMLCSGDQILLHPQPREIGFLFISLCIGIADYAQLWNQYGFFPLENSNLEWYFVFYITTETDMKFIDHAGAFDEVTHTAAAAKSLQSCPTLCDPIDGSHNAPPSLGFSRQEHWSGLPLPSPRLQCMGSQRLGHD